MSENQKKMFYKEVVGDRQMYRRVAHEVKKTMTYLHENPQNDIASISNKCILNCSAENLNLIIDNNDLNSNGDILGTSVYDIVDLSHSKKPDSNIYFSDSETVLSGSDLNNTYSSNDLFNISGFSNTETVESTHFNENENELKNDLKDWALRHNLTHVSVSDLLHILSPYHPLLPLDARTLLQTPVATTGQKQLSSGEYIHLGLASYLQNFLTYFPFFDSDIFEISFNIDGVPVFSNNNSPVQFWPILGLLKNVKCAQPKCFVVGVFCGSSKPIPLESYLRNFIDELLELLSHGLVFNNKIYKIKIHSFICDTPARAYIKCTKGHNGYSSCDRCTVSGNYINGHMIFDSVSSQKRTNLSFLAQEDGDHHIAVSPLTDLKIDFINLFPIDYMHCICLGVMKKIINSWSSGRFYKVRLPARVINVISEYLDNLSTFLPEEFNRKPQKLSEISYWKATQFRSFLLYFAPVVLKKHVNIAVYEHLLLLQTAVSILLSQRNLKKLGCDLAEQLLRTFVIHCKKIYGSDFLVHNVHALIHIADDARAYGVLDNISAFPFENHLGTIKKLIRSPNKPLQQLYRRLNELNAKNAVSTKPISSQVSLQANWKHWEGPTLTYTGFSQYVKICLEKMTFTIFNYSAKNSYCMSKENKVLQIHNILVDSNGEIIFICKEFLSYKSLFSYPFESSDLQIFIVDVLSKLLKDVNFHEILTKCIVFPLENNSCAAFPLLHDKN